MTFDWGLLPNFLYPKTVIKFGWQNCQKPNISLIYDISVAVICLTLTELTTEIEKFKNNWYISTKIKLRKICILGFVYSLYKITLKLNFLQVFGRKKWKGTSEVFNAKWQRYNLVWHISSLLEKWSTRTAEERSESSVLKWISRFNGGSTNKPSTFRPQDGPLGLSTYFLLPKQTVLIQKFQVLKK